MSLLLERLQSIICKLKMDVPAVIGWRDGLRLQGEMACLAGQKLHKQAIGLTMQSD